MCCIGQDGCFIKQAFYLKKKKYISLIHQFYKELIIAKNNRKPIFLPFRFFFTYLKQNRLKLNRLEEKVPWMTVPSYNFLNKLCKPGINVFEYGAGASTLFFGEKGVNLFSVEHNRNWFAQISKLINDAGYKYVSITLYEPSDNFEGEVVLSNKDEAYIKKNYIDYVNSINYFEDNSFDLIVIDGRARVACFRQAIPKLKDGGFLVFDNGDRKEYSLAIDQLKGSLILSDYTVSMFDLNFSQTNIYQIWK